MVETSSSSVQAYYPENRGELNEASECSSTRPARDEDRLAAVASIVECNDTSDPTIASILKLLRSLMKVDTVCVSMITETCVNLKQSFGEVSEGCSFAAPGFCFWSLVPEQPQVLIIEDTTLDARTSSSPLVTEAPHLRFYVAAPLVTCNQQRVGNLCLIHSQPLRFGTADAAVLSNFAELIMRVLERGVLEKDPANPILEGPHKRGRNAYDQAYAVVDTGVPGWKILHTNPIFDDLAGRTGEVSDQKDLFWNAFSEPEADGDCQHNEASRLEQRAAKQSLALHKRNGDSATPSGPLYAMLRPATAQKISEDALVVANPSRQDSAEFSDVSCDGEASPDGPSAYCYDKLYFILLVNERIEQKPELPIPDLRIGSALGAGAYAKVYRGLYRGRKVAIKVVHDLDPDLTEGGVPLEIVIMQGVDHPNLVKLWDYATQDGSVSCPERLWLVIEYCNGGTLSDAVDKGYFRLTPSQTAPPCMRTILITARELAQGLAHLHARGSLHCDISGGNVLLAASASNPHGFTVKLADFGLSRRHGVDYLAKRSAGTHTYLAPEVLKGEPPSQASDVYSFGVIMYEMICGKQPWAALNAFRVTYAIVFNGESLQVPDTTPPGIKAIVGSCLGHKAEERSSFIELVGLLDEQLKQQQHKSTMNGGPALTSEE